MSEENKLDCPTTQECEKPKAKFKKKRDIFRFNGQEEMSINLEHVYKIVRSGNKITFQATTADFVDFESDEAAKTAYDQIIGVWCSDVFE